MPELNKNHSARLRRVDQRLDRALDSLMQANGELWPTQLRPYGEKMQQAVTILQDLSKQIQGDVAGATVVEDPKEGPQVDVNQEDIEDVDKVAQPQPTSRPRRTAAA
jgi:hypothetical protein